jgi:RNA polymerase sigma-70 factor (ECF subfamily)
MNSLQRFALLLTRDPDRAEDLVQETLVRAMEGARTWQPGRDLRKWLFAILHNVHVSRCRRERLEADAATAMRNWAETSTPPRQGTRVHLNQTIAALLTLPEDQREVLVLIAVEGLSYRDAADILGIPVGTVMSRLGRAREALRRASEGGVSEGTTAVPTAPSAAADAAPSPRRPFLRLVE